MQDPYFIVEKGISQRISFRKHTEFKHNIMIKEKSFLFYSYLSDQRKEAF